MFKVEDLGFRGLGVQGLGIIFEALDKLCSIP